MQIGQRPTTHKMYDISMGISARPDGVNSAGESKLSPFPYVVPR
jgi:hypothetical protein